MMIVGPHLTVNQRDNPTLHDPQVCSDLRGLAYHEGGATGRVPGKKIALKLGELVLSIFQFEEITLVQTTLHLYAFNTNDYFLNPVEPMIRIKTGQEAIPNGATSVAVVFDEPFPGAPVVCCNVAMPSAADELRWASLDDSSVTTLGFTAIISGGPVPNGNYLLNWHAIYTQ